MNSIVLEDLLEETIERDVGTGANGPRTFAAIMVKIQQVSSSSIHTMVNNLKELRPNHRSRPGRQCLQLYKEIELACRIDGSSLPPLDLYSIFAGCLLE